MKPEDIIKYLKNKGYVEGFIDTKNGIAIGYKKEDGKRKNKHIDIFLLSSSKVNT